MLRKRKIAISILFSLCVLSFQDVVLFMTCTLEDEHIKITKIFIEVLLAIMYFVTTYVFLCTMNDFQKEKTKYNSEVQKLSITTFLYFFGLTSSIISEQEIEYKIMFFSIGIICLFLSVYYTWKIEEIKVNTILEN